MAKNVYVPVRQDARKMRYIEWLTTIPEHRNPRYERDLAKELDVFAKTLYSWRQDKEFREVWKDEADEVIGDAGRRQAVLETLYRAATDERNPRHVAAGKLYLEAIGAITPPKLDLTVSTKALSLLTQQEIDEMIAQQVFKMNQGEVDVAGRLPTEEHTG